MKRLLLLSLVSLAFIFSDGQSLQLQLPTKGDVWPIYSTQKIRWQYANVDNIKIEVSTDSARSWSVIQSSYPASATFYDWTVINTISDSCYVRITDVANPSVKSSGYPNNWFRIPKPVLKIDNIETPVFANAALPISWTAEGTQSIKLMASFDDNRSYQLITDNIPATQGFYNWLFKDIVAANCFILIQSNNNAGVSDTIEKPFSIKKLPLVDATKYKGGSYDGHTAATNKAKRLILLSPNQKENFDANTVYSVRWNSTSITQIDIKYSVDSGATWLNVATGLDANASAYNWTIPSAPTARGLIKISDASDPGMYDNSDSTFTIRTNTLRLTSPSENDTTFRGQVLPITWTSTGVAKINISYLDQSGWKTIANGVNATNEGFNWPVIANMPDSFRLKIADYDNPLSAYTVSNIYVRRTPSATVVKYNGGSYDGHSSGSNIRAHLILTNPNGNDQLPSAVASNISWKGAAVAKVDIKLSLDSGRTWQSIVSSYPNTGSFSWRVPGLASAKCLIRIQSTDDSTVSDISDAVFTILPKSIHLVSDPGNIYSGTAIPIEWRQVGIEKISLNYKTSRNGIWQKIIDALTSSAEVYNWVVPPLTADSLWLRVLDYTDPAIVDEQLLPTVLKRLPAMAIVKYNGGSFDGHASRSTNNKINIFKPAAADTLRIGNTYPISWSSGEVTDSILLQYSSDSGRTWKPITSLPAAVGQYNWLIPTDVGHRNSNVNSRTAADVYFNNCMVRAVQMQSNIEIVGVTNKTFSIVQTAVTPANTLSLTGVYSEMQVALKWVSENETNVNRYEVERSLDGLTYQKVGEVKGQNAGSYNYLDPVKELRGQKVFYRIRIVNGDREISYSSVLPINVPANMRFNIYPNPAKNFIQIQIASEVSGLVKVQVADVLGRIVVQKMVEATLSNFMLPTSDLHSGMYIVKITSDEVEYVRKIFVTK